jgi:hypothetical protein
LAGIRAAFEENGLEVELSIEQLNNQRDPRAAARFLAEYPLHIQDGPFDLVTTTDDEALEFIVEHPELFPGSPVVFGGVSKGKLLQNLDRGRITDVVEVFADLPMLDLALRLHRDTRRVTVITDGTPFSLDFSERFRQRAARQRDWTFQELSLANSSLRSLLDDLRSLQPGDLVMIASCARDNSGDFLPVTATLQSIADASPAPVYGLAEGADEIRDAFLPSIRPRLIDRKTVRPGSRRDRGPSRGPASGPGSQAGT